MKLFKNKITFETRQEAEEKVDKGKRYLEIITILKENKKPMTAKEIAVEMYKRGYSYSNERNISAPRLTELEQKEIVEVIGKVKCYYSGKTVAVYRLVNKCTHKN